MLPRLLWSASAAAHAATFALLGESAQLPQYPATQPCAVVSSLAGRSACNTTLDLDARLDDLLAYLRAEATVAQRAHLLQNTVRPACECSSSSSAGASLCPGTVSFDQRFFVTATTHACPSTFFLAATCGRAINFVRKRNNGLLKSAEAM